MRIKLILCFGLTILLSSCFNKFSTHRDLERVTSIEALNDISEFSFIIFSDNHGFATENRYFNRMDSIRVVSEAKFAIGVGDHVKRRRHRPFLDLLRDDEWWRDNFFPNIADGENETFGASQCDW